MGGEGQGDRSCELTCGPVQGVPPQREQHHCVCQGRGMWWCRKLHKSCTKPLNARPPSNSQNPAVQQLTSFLLSKLSQNVLPDSALTNCTEVYEGLTGLHAATDECTHPLPPSPIHTIHKGVAATLRSQGAERRGLFPRSQGEEAVGKGGKRGGRGLFTKLALADFSASVASISGPQSTRSCGRKW